MIESRYFTSKEKWQEGQEQKLLNYFRNDGKKTLQKVTVL